ncbi:MAG: DMT family transporter [Rhodospirillales bacterium]
MFKSDIFKHKINSPGTTGALWMILSALGWATMVSVARGLKDDLHVFEISFFRSFFALVFFIPWLTRSGLKALKTEKIGLHFIRGVSGLIALYLMFGALFYIPTGEVAAITFLRPLVASACVILIMGEPSKAHRWVSITIGLIGAYIIVRPGISAVSPGQFLAFGAVFAMVVTSLMIKTLTKTDQPDAIAAWQVIIFSALSIIPALFVWVTPTLEQFGALLIMGFGAMVAQRAMTRAYKAADLTVVLPFEYTRLPMAAFFGLVLFSEFPDLWTWIGGTIIFGATVYMAHREAQNSELTQTNEPKDKGK